MDALDQHRGGQRALYAVPRGPAQEKLRWPEPEHSFRSPFQRDRDRVVHSRAFRRLESKTQVFLSGKGDHYRTRLTHTIEVAAIARTLARGLHANEDLAEAVALAHDLGHPPFGHMGELALERLMRKTGERFEHNQQSLRVVDRLERRYPDFHGLNLTWEVRDALMKRRHGTAALDGNTLSPQPCLEAQIADLADDLAYLVHDTDDGLESGLLTAPQIASQPLWLMAQQNAVDRADCRQADHDVLTAFTLRCMLDMMVQDVLEQTRSCLQTWQPQSYAQIKNAARPVVTVSSHLNSPCQQLRAFLFENLYRHHAVLDVNYRTEQVVRELFHYYCEHPQHMGRGSQQRAQSEGLRRAVADYIAGMTDRFALQCYDRIAGQHTDHANC